MATFFKLLAIFLQIVTNKVFLIINRNVY